jgi:CheY-specific phosphatase CheX
MRFDYVDAFVDAARDVIEAIVPTSLDEKPPTLHEFLVSSGISATVQLSGAVEGCVMLDIEPEVAKQIASLMNGMEFDKLDDLAIDTICELSNIIVGKAITTLNNRGFKFRTSPPCFFNGKKMYPLESMTIGLSTRWGDVSIKVAVKERV